MNKLILPYKYGSESAKLLKELTGIKFLKKNTNRPVPRDSLIINWGCSVLPNRDLNGADIVNKPESVRKASNKLSTFIHLKDEGIIPDFTENVSEARLMASRGIVVARHILNGHSGQGIELIPKNSETIPEAPLYVEYIKKKREYRVHVFCEEIIFIQEKRKRIEAENVNWQIRNHANGFIFASDNVELDEEGKRAAIIAVSKLGLDFGAVDLIYNEYRNKYYVLEVNTAPGITGRTAEIYKEILNEL